jgi:acyl carrier protein
MAASPQAGGWQRSFPGIRQLPIEDGLKLWERILRDNDSNQLAAFLIGPGVSIPGLEAGVQGDRVKDRQPEEMGDKFRSRTGAAGLSVGELILFLQEEVTKIMGIEDSRLVDAQQPLFDAGLDSLMAVEFRNVLASAFDRVLPSTLLFDYPTLHKLAVFLKGSGSRQNPPENKPENNRLAREIQDLEESAAEFLLQAELDREN